jgi:hypothetical protein
MKPEQYKKKAREAFAKSLIEIGVAVFKGIILLITVVPLTAVLKGAFDGTENEVSLPQIIGTLSFETKAAILVLMAGGFYVGHFLRKEGLRHLHEIEDKT